jgi:hypothetical protein
VSSESEGEAVDLRAIRAGSEAASGLEGGEALTGFAEAVVRGDNEAIATTRERLRVDLGDAATVDAAGVIGNFERMVRIADGTGIPLDRPVVLVSADDRAALGIDAFEGAGRIRGVTFPERLLGRAMARIMPTVLRWFRNR